MRLALNSAAGLRSRAFAALLVAVAITFAGGLPPRTVGQEDDAARPSLGDLMALIQLRHFKLWYAQRVGNWQLADYELGQFEQTMRRIGNAIPDGALDCPRGAYSREDRPAHGGSPPSACRKEQRALRGGLYAAYERLQPVSSSDRCGLYRGANANRVAA